MSCTSCKKKSVQVLLIIFTVFAGAAFAQSQEVELKTLEMREGLRYLAGENRPFSGAGITRYSSGNMASKITFRHGLQHGLETGWYQSGQLKHEIMYRSGQPQTLGSTWYEDKPEKTEAFLLCSEGGRMAGYCGQSVDKDSYFEPCIEGEKCDELEPDSTFRSCSDGEC